MTQDSGRVMGPDERERLGLKIARAIAPHEWRRYDLGGGKCTNAEGMRCIDSIHESARVLDLLEEEGLIGKPS